MSSADLSAAAHNALSLVSPDVTTFAAFTGNSVTILCSSHKGTFFRPTLHSGKGEKKFPQDKTRLSPFLCPPSPPISMLMNKTHPKYKKGTFFRPPIALHKPMPTTLILGVWGATDTPLTLRRELFFALTGTPKCKKRRATKTGEYKIREDPQVHRNTNSSEMKTFGEGLATGGHQRASG